MIESFTVALADARASGASEAEIKKQIDTLEEANRGKMPDDVLSEIVAELRSAARPPHPAPPSRQ